MIRVDAHHHLWDPAARNYPFLAGDDLAPIHRRYSLADLRDNAAVLGVDRTILVQTVSDEVETREFLQTAADSTGLIAGVVGWVDLTAPDLAERIDLLRDGPGGQFLVGIRHQIQDEPDPDWALRPEVLRGIRTLGASGLTFDLLVQETQWTAAVELCRACPDTPIVLDHAGKPPIASGNLGGWSRWIRTLTAQEHVMVKLSGLVTEADWDHWRSAELAPVVDTVLDVFGPQRVMVGSDWPVAELAGPVQRSWEAVTELVRARAGEAPLGATAAQFYSVPATDGSNTG